MGTPTTLLRIPLGTWFKKKREFVIRIPGKAGLSAEQLSEWMAFSSIEPIGEFRNELRHGQMMALHANINRDSKQRREPYLAKDFMNFIEKEPEKVATPEELEAYANQIFGG